MTETVLLFAPDGADDDDPLVRTRWIADCTRRELADRGIATHAVFGAEATRDGLERAMNDEISGLAFFSHGRLARIGPRRRAAHHDDEKPSEINKIADDAIMGANGPALDRDNLALVNRRWGHAVACHVGTELAAHACVAGAVCFVGYTGTLVVEWHPADVPADIEPTLARLVTRTTCNLAAGVRDERQLKKHINAVADEIAAWCQDNEERAEGLFLEVTAQQLVRLVYHPKQEA